MFSSKSSQKTSSTPKNTQSRTNVASSTSDALKKIDSEAITSIIDNTMSIVGEISFKGKARIDGTVKGNIKGEHLILSESGRIEGDLELESFNCFGILQGNVTAQILTARKSCAIQGKIDAGSLTVEPGAQISGEMKVASMAPAEPVAPSTKPSPKK